MRITCPLCGERDRREFTYKGTALAIPALDAGVEAWDDYVHMRDNQPGAIDEWWQHDMGCGSWLKVTRNTVSHEMIAVVAGEASELGLTAAEVQAEDQA